MKSKEFGYIRTLFLADKNKRDTFDASIQNDQKIAQKMSNDIENMSGKDYNSNKLYHEKLFVVRQKL